MPANELHAEFPLAPVVVAIPEEVPMEELRMESFGPLPTATEGEIRVAGAPLVQPPDPSHSPGRWLLWMWVAGGVATLLPGLLSLLAARRLHRSAPPREIVNLWCDVAGRRSATVPVRISSDLVAPGIASVFRQEVLLPEAALAWERERLRSVLKHEFHHIRQGDAGLRWLGRLARALLWFHPAAWWIQARLVIAQERAADEAVIADGVPAPDYAGHLLALASGSPPFPGIAVARRSQVGRRIRAMLHGRADVSRRRASIECRAAFAMGILGFLAVLVGFGGPETLHAESIDETGFRGPILDRNGVLLATSDPARMPEEVRIKSPVRWYPEGASHGHSTGYVFKNDRGEAVVGERSGLECSAVLSTGAALKLTLDARIQRLAAQALAERPLPGAILVMDPHTCDVLAMASSPACDPNRFADGFSMEEWRAISEGESAPLVNRAALPVPPGSFAKLLVALAAARVDKADRVIHCGPSVSVGLSKFRDWNSERDEEMDLRSALSTSCNTYFVPLALESGSDALAAIRKDFGFGPGKGAPWSWAARWPSRDEDREVTSSDIAISAVGHGQSSLALLDMARVMSAVASGTIRPARFSEADPLSVSTPLVDLGIDDRELALIRRGLVDLIHSPRGVGKRAKIDGTLVAGITATSQWSKDGHAASFSGYAPADRPRFVVSALFLRGRDDFSKEPNFSGGTSAAPVAAAVMKALLEGGY